MAAALLGLLIALLTMKMDAMFAALLAWFVGIVLQNIIAAIPDITRGAMGLNVTALFETPWAKPYFYVIFTICVLTFCCLRKMVDSRFGLAFRALGQDIEAAKAVGISPLKYRTINFVISCFIAGIVGGFYAHYVGVLSPNVLGTKNVVQILVLAYIGGRGSIWGPLLASFLIMPVFEAMNSLVEIKYIIYGLLLIISMIYFPGGFCKIPGKVRVMVAVRADSREKNNQSEKRRRRIMKKLSKILVILLTLSLIPSACGGGSSSDSGEKVLKIAVGCSLTGTGAKAGTAFEEATKWLLRILITRSVTMRLNSLQ